MTLTPTQSHLPQHVEVAVIGAGFAGLAMAIKLIRQGIDDFVVLERADDVGGTWRDNVYPGCACDIPSHLYSLSFAPSTTWSRYFATQPEIHDYLRRCAADHGVTPHLRFGHTVTEARWDESSDVWRIVTSRGRTTARHLVLAGGALSEPAVPAIEGLDDFGGRTFHSSRWDHSHDLAGRQVAVIGTGASAIQIVPAIQPQVARLTVFQRSAAWILPRPDREIPAWQQRLLRWFPPLRRAVRAGLYALHELFVPALLGNERWLAAAEKAAREHLERQVTDPDLRRRLTPDHRLGCQRVLSSDDFYPALDRPNADVVTAPIRRVVAGGIETEDGVVHPADTLILATGFRVSDHPMSGIVHGRDGVTLAESWDGSPQAYRGISVHGFPNLHLLTGPNTGLGHNSVLLMIEAQVDHIVALLSGLAGKGDVVEVRPWAQHEDVADIDRRMRSTVWVTGDCRSWYIDRRGRNSTLWPGWVHGYRRRVKRVDWSALEVRRAAARPTPQPRRALR
jgi:cation diffusion facilitator CzcD-associated flavoprotein CzcO